MERGVVARVAVLELREGGRVERPAEPVSEARGGLHEAPGDRERGNALEAEPAAVILEELPQRDDFRPDRVDRLPHERVGLERLRDERAEIVDVNRLESLGACARERYREGQRRHRAQERRAAVGAARDDERGPHHDPVERARAQVVVGGELRERVVGACLAIGADGRELDHAANARTPARLEERDGRGAWIASIDCERVPCRMPAQFTTASMPASRGIHVSAATSRSRSTTSARSAANGGAEPAVRTRGDHPVPAGGERGEKLAADESRGAEEEDAHLSGARSRRGGRARRALVAVVAPQVLRGAFAHELLDHLVHLARGIAALGRQGSFERREVQPEPSPAERRSA